MSKDQSGSDDLANAVRDKIIDAAVKQFSELGFEGASTRAIAATAGVAMSSITYQFGGKEGLYLATADHIGEQIATAVQPKLVLATQSVAAGTMSATDAVLLILGGMVELMLDDRSEAWASFIIREQQSPSEAFERLYDRIMRHVSDAMIELVGKARTDLSGVELRAVAMGMVGQVIALRATRAAMMRTLGFASIGPDESRIIREAVQGNARAILEAKG